MTGEEGDVDFGEGEGGSGKRRYRYFGECGHDVCTRRPEEAVKEVEWVMERLKERGLG